MLFQSGGLLWGSPGLGEKGVLFWRGGPASDVRGQNGTPRKSQSNPIRLPVC